MAYPLNFESVTQSECGITGVWSSRSGDFESSIAIPPEFAGPGGGLSPEDLFNHALTNCFVATFKVYAQNSKLTFDRIEAHSKLVVDLDDNRKPVMKALEVRVRIENPSDRDKALMLAQKASRSGFILNSVKTDCQFFFEF